jgi:hypothetical protein
MLQYVVCFLGFSIWMGATALFITSIVMIAFHEMWRYYVIVLYGIYYTGRYFFPLERWPAFQRFISKGNDQLSYFLKQQLIFDDSKPPPQDSKSLLAYHPHGILCCGWY